MKTVLAILALCASVLAQQPTPCPEVFQYLNQEPGKWIGELTLQSEFPLSGLWIRVILDKSFDTVTSSIGETALRETASEKGFLIKDKNYNLIPGKTIKIQITVTYPANEPAPNLLSARVNARTVCPASKDVINIVKCPGVFNYDKEKNEENRWHGTLTVKSEFELKGLWIRVVLDKPAELFVNEFGETVTEDNISYLIKNPNFALESGKTINLPISVKFSSNEKAPVVRTVRVNGRTVCGDIISEDNQNRIIVVPEKVTDGVHTSIRAPDVERPTSRIPFNQQSKLSPNVGKTVQLTTSAPFSVSSTSAPSSSTTTTPLAPSTTTTIEFNRTQNAFISCGTVVPESLNLIVRGERARIAQWPWHGAIYLIQPRNLNYICGMSLISDTHALTAAHCVVESLMSKKLREPQSMVLYFGLLHRRNFTASTVQRPQVKKITVHPDYSESGSDIAVIQFEKPVQFTDWVRPICLWEGDIDMRYIVNQTGTVVGFGVTETQEISDELLFANILVVDTLACIFSNRDFYSKYTSPTTFCAGNLTQSAVCNGDSGGGMIFKRDGTDVWQIRGIVSTAVRDKDTGLCDYNNYAIFTDTSKYQDWIEKVMAE